VVQVDFARIPFCRVLASAFESVHAPDRGGPPFHFALKGVPVDVVSDVGGVGR